MWRKKENKKTIVIIAIGLALALIALIIARCSRDNGAGLSECEKLEAKIAREVKKELNYCESASDCTLLNGCPYGCNNLINKNADMGALAELSSEYTDTCGACETDCRNVLKPHEIKCEDGKCVSTRR